MKIKFTDNEAALLITGDILMATGGVILGLLIELTQIRYYLIPICVISFALGGYFDYKSIRTFSTKLTTLKNEISVAQKRLESTIEEVKEATQNLEKTNEKVFGSSNPMFSKFRFGNSAEDQMKELERKVKDLNDKFKTLENKYRFNL